MVKRAKTKTMFASSAPLPLLFLLPPPAAHAILASTRLACATSCGNILDATSAADIVCTTGAFDGPIGQLFQGCVDCEMRGGGPSDTQAMLFNVQYALSHCLFAYPVNQQLVNSPCVTRKACGPFRNAIKYGNLSAEHASYAYCERWPAGNDVDYRSCGECLQAAESYYLANFVTVLQAGCEQQPAPGVRVGIQGNVFSTDSVNITAPSPTATVDPAWFDRGPLSLGAKVAISVAGFVLLLVGLGCGIVLNGKRRRRAYLRRLEAQCAQAGWPSLGQQPEPQPAWEDSPLMAVGSPEKPYGAYPSYLSPYSSQHSSPVSAHGAASPSTHMPPAAALTALGIIHPGQGQESLPSHPQPYPDAAEAETETFEMHQVDVARTGTSVSRRAEAPVLAHPGYGRPRQYAPAEADGRMDTAI